MPRLTKEPPILHAAQNFLDFSIAFKHPHYPEAYNQNVIFSLEGYDAYDKEESDRERPEQQEGSEGALQERRGGQQEGSGMVLQEGRGGLHYGTALTACALVSGNCWNGYFTQERDGQKLDMAHDHLLTGSAYYFHVPTATGESYQYSVYPSFEHWAFPHNTFPTAWRRPASPTDSHNVPSVRSNVTAAVLQRDRTCIVTGQIDYMERAHLCPSNEQAWFRLNHMSQYNMNQRLSPEYSTDDTSNALALRPDIHWAFDDGTFAIVPKEGSWVPHFFRSTHDLGPRYHNMTLALNSGISVQHLLARFAWAIFPLVRNFLQGGGDRAVKFHVFNEEERQHEEKTEVMNIKDITAKFFAPRARSNSSKKRSREDTTQEDDDGRAFKRTRCLSFEDNAAESTWGSTEPSSASGGLVTLQDDVHVHVKDNERLPPSDENAFDRHLESEWAGQAGEADFDEHIENLRRRQLLKRRPSDPSLYCCDYNRADMLTNRGVPGKREWGGSHLCEECLGGEYLPLADFEGETDCGDGGCAASTS